MNYLGIKLDSEMINLCLHCGSPGEMEEDRSIFYGQIYSDKYPPDVACQDHGYRIRCVKCGCQTCWWHYKQEAKNAWNKFVNKEKVRIMDQTKEETFNELKEHVGKLFYLLDRPRPFIPTWCERVQDEWKEISDMWVGGVSKKRGEGER